MKKTIKKIVQPIIPKSLINFFHFSESIAAAQKYQHPSNKMIVIGLVGSKGKTTTANMLWSILSAEGHKVGLIGTANIRFGQKEELNHYHMTMPGAFVLQGLLAKMSAMHCKYVVMEVPSEGQTQHRHVGINFDVLIFTNVTNELMAAHGYSIDTLHKHNKRVFKRLNHSKRKTIGLQKIAKIIVANIDSKDAPDYLLFQSDKKITFGRSKDADFRISNIAQIPDKISFDVNGDNYTTKILGKINAINATGAIATAVALGISDRSIKQGLAKLPTIPGRMEVIESKQPFAVVVDYAHEQASMTALMDSARDMIPKGAKVITLLGAEGGGRDSAKRPEMGAICAKGSDIIILSNVDPYDDDPEVILADIAEGALGAGAEKNKSMFIVPDRREGIRKALQLAQKDDLVLITGKGAEQSMEIGGQSIAWDDRKVVREELAKLVG